MNKLIIKTKKTNEIIDITDKIIKLTKYKKINDGLCNIFIKHTTASICIMENEIGVKKDLINTLNNIAPNKKSYEHHKTACDENGSAHIKASLVGSSLSIPIENYCLSLGKWQKIVLIEFDTGRTREIIVNFLKL